jgi:peptidyl-prolyl cis-trans isomerase SurA
MKKSILALVVAAVGYTHGFAQQKDTSRPTQTNSQKAAPQKQMPAPGSPQPKVAGVDTANLVLMTIGDTKVTLGEFMYVYKKNNKDQAGDTTALNNYLDLFTTFKMKVKEAQDLKMDTSAAFKNELAGYRRQVAQPYLTDKKVNDSLYLEAYNRMKEDIRASHILIRLDENSLPKDTDIAYTKINIIQGLLAGKPVAKQVADYEAKLKAKYKISKESSPSDTLRVYNLVNPLKQLERKYRGKPAPFDDVAFMASEDESARQNRGDLGYFTAFSMVYQFETLCYSTPVGKIGGPARTRYGYHIVYVHDRRPAQGEVLVAHIMVKAPMGMATQDSINAKNKIDEIYGKVKAGEDFATLARQFSDDKPSAAKGGEMPWFGLYKMPAPFEKAAFGLQNNGDYSEPVKTDWGWHIVKRLDRRMVPTFEQSKNDIKARCNRDQRGQQGKTALIEAVKKENGFIEYPKVKTEMYKVVDSTIFMGKWVAAEKAKGMNKVLFTLDGKNYTQMDFAVWMETQQVRRAKTEIKKLVDDSYTAYVNEMCITLEDSKLEKKYAEFGYLMQEYRDGILLFDLMDQRVWSKAVKDTVGLRTFYEGNKNNYMWPERADAVVYSCKDAKTAKMVRKMISKGKTEKEILAEVNKDSQLNVQAERKLWTKGENAAVDGNWKAGTSADQMKDNRVTFVHTYEVQQPKPKTLQEARGVITTDYQNRLEREWVDSLKAKYPVQVNREVLKLVK